MRHAIQSIQPSCPTTINFLKAVWSCFLRNRKFFVWHQIRNSAAFCILMMMLCYQRLVHWAIQHKRLFRNERSWIQAQALRLASCSIWAQKLDSMRHYVFTINDFSIWIVLKIKLIFQRKMFWGMSGDPKNMTKKYLPVLPPVANGV